MCFAAKNKGILGPDVVSAWVLLFSVGIVINAHSHIQISLLYDIYVVHAYLSHVYPKQTLRSYIILCICYKNFIYFQINMRK